LTETIQDIANSHSNPDVDINIKCTNALTPCPDASGFNDGVQCYPVSLERIGAEDAADPDNIAKLDEEDAALLVDGNLLLPFNVGPNFNPVAYSFGAFEGSRTFADQNDITNSDHFWTDVTFISLLDKPITVNTLDEWRVSKNAQNWFDVDALFIDENEPEPGSDDESDDGSDDGSVDFGPDFPAIVSPEAPAITVNHEFVHSIALDNPTCKYLLDISSNIR
jgi:hypothetical protein